MKELGPEGPAQVGRDPSADLGSGRPVSVRTAREPFGPHAGGQDDDGVAEVDGASPGVGEPTVAQDLQQDVEDVGVCLLDLVEQHHRVGLASYRLGELPALDGPGLAGWGAQ